VKEATEQVRFMQKKGRKGMHAPLLPVPRLTPKKARCWSIQLGTVEIVTPFSLNLCPWSGEFVACRVIEESERVGGKDRRRACQSDQPGTCSIKLLTGPMVTLRMQCSCGVTERALEDVCE
jgi:hypothetical protein